MREFITPERTANKIRLMRTQFQGSFLLVEGDSDARFYKNLVNPEKCKINIAQGKNNLIQVLDILEGEQFLGVLAIIDADFDRLENNLPTQTNILLTDSHDLETMLLQSPALEKVLGEFGSEDKIYKLNQDIRSILLAGGVYIGYLRWISLKDSLELKFEGLSFSKFINKKTLAIDRLQLIETVKNNSQKPQINQQEIEQKMKSLERENHDAWCVCCGHDLIEILSMGLCQLLGSNNSKDVEADKIEKILRLAYESSYFRKTKLYSLIQQWESCNKPFVILHQAE
ncbi:DUF4435 domain-containing protein [Limnoraphis robusta]|uniref:DUF4435 domain-containing protein n=1 Tax=Limnoraphis robusta CCNP1315 TaxID=3110306 RepID=A0ABU5TTZ0_9CYAN|nr:DUF4435 domain-containing protein [Limnoraphis robusta]MEA5518371.1 DUF4435 domain-containing protein [Limnoraphis robusta CCNP1315]MEA5547752.1 DUF4435 domain-containing protein [Limnoraphis robusta CCNP1324]